jgi:hypothetical protein
MPSQSAIEVLEVIERADDALTVTLRLACGCVVTRDIARDRLLVTDEGEKRAIGKYPGPLDHPVCAPR